MNKIKKICSFLVISLFITMSFFGTKSWSQDKFPTKAVEMTILFGGTAKTIGEVIADGLSKELNNLF